MESIDSYSEVTAPPAPTSIGDRIKISPGTYINRPLVVSHDIEDVGKYFPVTPEDLESLPSSLSTCLKRMF